MALHGVPVTPGRRPGEGPTGSEREGVVGGGVDEPGEGLEGEVDGGGHPLDLPDEGHQMVGGDGGGGVVGRPALVLDGDGPPVEGLGHAPGHRVTGHGEGDARAQSLGPDLRGGQGHEGVERSASTVAVEHVEAERA